MRLRAPYAQTWNAGVQTSLPGGLLAELMYSGTKGTRLPIQLLPNQGPLQAAPTLNAGNKPSGFVYETSDGNSISHSGQIRLSRPFHAGISTTMIYRYGKTIDNSSGLPNVGGGVVQDFRNFRAERAISDFDRRQTMHLELLWEPAFEIFKNTRRWPTGVIKGWTIASNILSEDGTPRTALVMGKEPAEVIGTGIIGSGRARAAVDLGHRPSCKFSFRLFQPDGLRTSSIRRVWQRRSKYNSRIVLASNQRIDPASSICHW